jgi:hypothetical protein
MCTVYSKNGEFLSFKLADLNILYRSSKEFKNYPTNLSLAKSGKVGQNKRKRKPHMADNFPGAT